MTKLKHCLLIAIILLTACARLDSNKISYENRYPSSESAEEKDFLKFKKSTFPSANDIGDEAKLKIEEYFKYQNIFRSEFVLSKKLPSDTAFQIELDIIESKYIIRIIHSPDAFKNHEAVIGIAGLIRNILNKEAVPILNSPYEFFEMYYNAIAGDPESIVNFLKMRKQFLASSGLTNLSLPEESILENIHKDIDEQIAIISPKIKKAIKERNEKKLARKKMIEQLDKAADDKQFKALVAKNDRKGVVALLRSYLPFEDMPPMEKRFWENYLEVILHPIPLEKRILIYRGLDDDMLNLATKNGEELSKEESIKQAKVFFMSTVLVKNQGSWNRRLRSLETMEDKTINKIFNSNQFSISAQITTMFKNHSVDPMGSPFLSLSPNPDVAAQFGSHRSGIFLIDPRLLNFNFTSGFESEKEFLLPLATFPDEIIALWDKSAYPNITWHEFIPQKVDEFISTKFGKENKDAIISDIKKNSYDFFNRIYKPDGLTASPKSKIKGNALDFFNQFASTKSEVPPSFDPNGNYKCEDLLEFFWIK